MWTKSIALGMILVATGGLLLNEGVFASAQEGRPTAEALVTLKVKTAGNMDAVLLIDNSGSMDWPGRDPGGLRWDGAKIFIDKSKEGDQIALIDFSSESILLQPLTRITKTGRQKAFLKRRACMVKSDGRLTDINAALLRALEELEGSRADLTHIPVVILLTDGEIDVVEGTEEKKRQAALRSRTALMKETLPRYIRGHIPIYTVALTDKTDLPLLEDLAEKSKLSEQINEQHYFFAPTDSELVPIFSRIVNQIKGTPGITRVLYFSGEKIQQSFTVSPLAHEAAFEFTFGNEGNFEITLVDPDGHIVEPCAKEQNYQLYAIERPQAGTWGITIDGTGQGKITQTVILKEDVEISLPFPVRFTLGDRIPIFANVRHKDKLIKGASFEVDFEERKGVFSIEKLFFDIQRPDGTPDGPFVLEEEDGDYTFFYEKADLPGEYVLNFTLKGKISGEEVTVRAQKRIFAKKVTIQAQKRIFLSRRVGKPTVSLSAIQDEYPVGDPIELRIGVIEHADLMQAGSIPVEVISPHGSQTVSVPRKRRSLYAFEYPRTDLEGEYTFIIKQDQGYKAIGVQRTTTVGSSSSFPWLVLGLSAAFLIVVVLPLAVMLRKRSLKGKEGEEVSLSPPLPLSPPLVPVEPQVEEHVPATYVQHDIMRSWDNCITLEMPRDIILWENSIVAKRVSLKRRRGGEGYSYFLRADRGEVFVNEDILSEGGETKVRDGDIIEMGEVAFKAMPEGESSRVLLNSLGGFQLSITPVGGEGKIKEWSIREKGSPFPQVGRSIPLDFAGRDIVRIGRDARASLNVLNNVALWHNSVAVRQAGITRTRKKGRADYVYSLKAFEGKTLINDRVLTSMNEAELKDGDLLRVGGFTFKMVLGEDEPPRLEVVDAPKPPPA